ncbi:MAG: DUF3105 domain-containing protein, partial [Deltaproteobacteria bacterium]|nr:DUF3105 domain-containing protein [Deltaproteobacteria bacterium]
MKVPGDGGAVTPDSAGTDTTVTPTWSEPVGPCAVRTATFPLLGAAHVAACSTLTVPSLPPTSGSHYPSWPVFRAYDKPVPWGFLLHGMEHGVVVIS